MRYQLLAMGIASGALALSIHSTSINQQMQDIVNADGSDNCKVFITSIDGYIYNSTDSSFMQTFLSKEEVEQYHSEEGELQVATFYDEKAGEIRVTYSRTLYKDGIEDGMIVYQINGSDIGNMTAQSFEMVNATKEVIGVLETSVKMFKL